MNEPLIEDAEKTNLMKAAECGDRESILMYKSQSGYQNEKEHNLSALMYAVIYNNIDCIDFLAGLENGLRDKDGNTALILAAYLGRFNAVKILAKYETKTQNIYGFTALHIASLLNNIEIVCHLLPLESNIVNTKTNFTALYYSIYSRSEEAFNSLVQCENRVTNWEKGLSALHLAVINCDVEGFIKLYEIEKSYGEKNKFPLMENNITFLMFVVAHPDFVHSLLQADGVTDDNKPGSSNTNTVAKYKGRNNNIVGKKGSELLIDLVQKYKTVKDKHGRTALMIAAASFSNVAGDQAKSQYSENVETLFRLLVQYEGKEKDLAGKTALMYAAATGNLIGCRVLVEYECKMLDNAGNTALYYAVINKKREVISLLLMVESGIYCENGAITCLMKAAEADYADGIRELIGAERGLKSNEGLEETALIKAVIENSINSLIILSDAEANLTDAQGITALCHAVLNDNIEAAKILVFFEGGLNNKNNAPVLALAALHKHYDIMRLLLPFEWFSTYKKMTIYHLISIIKSDDDNANFSFLEKFECPCGEILLEKKRNHSSNKSKEVSYIIKEKEHLSNCNYTIKCNICKKEVLRKEMQYHLTKAHYFHYNNRYAFKDDLHARDNTENGFYSAADNFSTKEVKICVDCGIPHSRISEDDTQHFFPHKLIHCVCGKKVRLYEIKDHMSRDDRHHLVKCECGLSFCGSPSIRLHQEISLLHKRKKCLMCGEVLIEGNMEKHLKSDKHKIVKCSCGENIAAFNLEEHLKMHQKYQCICGEILEQKLLLPKHMVESSNHAVLRCAGCGLSLEAYLLEKHRESCPDLRKCVCGEYVPLFLVKKHLKELNHKKVKCSKCKKIILKFQYDDHREKEHLQILCRCGETYDKYEKNIHYSKSNAHQLVLCECGEKVEKMDLEQHIKFLHIGQMSRYPADLQIGCGMVDIPTIETAYLPVVPTAVEPSLHSDIESKENEDPCSITASPCIEFSYQNIKESDL